MVDASDPKVRQYYDDFSQTYEDPRGRGYHRMIDELETELVTPYARGAHVLELGCGTGLILEKVAAVAKEAIGIDLSEGMAKRSKIVCKLARLQATADSGSSPQGQR